MAHTAAILANNVSNTENGEATRDCVQFLNTVTAAITLCPSCNMAGARPTASPVMYRMLPLSQMRLYNKQQKYFSSGVVTQTKRCFSEQPAVVQEET